MAAPASKGLSVPIACDSEAGGGLILAVAVQMCGHGELVMLKHPNPRDVSGIKPPQKH